MGEVWRAKDTKLDREVAIKTLPEEFAADPDRLARFEREAKLLASLNHPNIGTIHGLVESDTESRADSDAEAVGTTALVLELVEGDTLADRIQRGALSVDDALGLAAQIASALEAAHDKGVVHRDLKPGNVMIAAGTADAPAGTVKVLDFGLAKAFDGERGSDPSLTNSPTLSMAATQQGVILGTAGYMSPEQASGSVSDRRADIWAFGVMLFEMLAGQPVFGGETVSHTLAAVLARDPDWSLLPAHLHPRLRELLERCLQKKPAERYRDIGDVRADLDRVRADPQGAIVTAAATTAPPGLRSALPWVAGASAVCLLLAGVVGWALWPSPEPGPVLQFPLALPDGHRLASPLRAVAVSPDGTRIAYTARAQALFVWDLREPEPRMVAETGRNSLGVAQPVFSPDGEWLAYLSLRGPTTIELKRVPVRGGRRTPSSSRG